MAHYKPIKIVDQCKCICRKNKTYGIYLQCDKKKKYGDFCGLHFNKKNIILCNQELPDKYKKYISFESFQKKEMTILSKTSELILMNTLKFYKLDTPEKIDKAKSIIEIKNFFNLLKIYNSEQNLKKVIIIQKFFKYYKNNKDSILRGPGFLNRSNCNNQEDFFTFELLEDIPNKFFFSFKDKDSFIYGFDIRSFKKLIEKNNINPYNRNKIHDNVMSNYNKLIKNLNLEFKEVESLQGILNKNKIKFETIKVFQKIDELDSYAGGININWFLNLSRRNLREYYKLLEDIWNYRAELSHEKKKEIVLNNIMFKMSVKNFYNLKEKNKMREIILNEINLLVDSSPKRENKILGSYYVLTALVSISQEAATTLPWLIQGY